MNFLKCNLPPGLEQPPSKVKSPKSPPRKGVVDHPPAEVNPAIREARLRSSQLRQEYLQSLGRMQYCEEAEKKASIRLQAAERLQQMLQDRKKLEERKQVERAFVQQLTEDEMNRKQALFTGERQRREQTRHKMETLFMAKKADVDTLKDEIQKTKDDGSKWRGERLAFNREYIQNEREHRRAHRLQFAETRQAELQKDRELQRSLRDSTLMSLKASKESELRDRARLAAQIKSTFRANRGKATEKHLLATQGLAQRQAEERLEKHRQEIAFFSDEINRLRRQEREAQARMEVQQAKLRAAIGELGEPSRAASPGFMRPPSKGPEPT